MLLNFKSENMSYVKWVAFLLHNVKLIIMKRTETWIWERIFCQFTLTCSFHFRFSSFLSEPEAFICFIEAITCWNVLRSHVSCHCFNITSHLVWRSFFCKTIHHWFRNCNISTFIQRKWFRNYHNYFLASPIKQLITAVTF